MGNRLPEVEKYLYSLPKFSTRPIRIGHNIGAGLKSMMNSLDGCFRPVPHSPSRERDSSTVLQHLGRDLEPSCSSTEPRHRSADDS
jgi:hypothetical protein